MFPTLSRVFSSNSCGINHYRRGVVLGNVVSKGHNINVKDEDVINVFHGTTTKFIVGVQIQAYIFWFCWMCGPSKIKRTSSDQGSRGDGLWYLKTYQNYLRWSDHYLWGCRLGGLQCLLVEVYNSPKFLSIWGMVMRSLLKSCPPLFLRKAIFRCNSSFVNRSWICFLMASWLMVHLSSRSSFCFSFLMSILTSVYNYFILF